VRLLVRDRDSTVTAGFSDVLASSGAQTILTPVRSPKANAFAEHWVRTVREECLDHLLVICRRQREGVLAEYVDHDNRARPRHRLALTPTPPATVAGRAGTIRRDVLGGLIRKHELATWPA
jgi:hypothetical protein